MAVISRGTFVTYLDDIYILRSLSHFNEEIWIRMHVLIQAKVASTNLNRIFPEFESHLLSPNPKGWEMRASGRQFLSYCSVRSLSTTYHICWDEPQSLWYTFSVRLYFLSFPQGTGHPTVDQASIRWMAYVLTKEYATTWDPKCSEEMRHVSDCLKCLRTLSWIYAAPHIIENGSAECEVE